MFQRPRGQMSKAMAELQEQLDEAHEQSSEDAPGSILADLKAQPWKRMRLAAPLPSTLSPGQASTVTPVDASESPREPLEAGAPLEMPGTSSDATPQDTPS
jgi:hypothetical protein